MKSLFVSIASYRDSEIIPTLKSMIANCSQDTELRIAVANQGSAVDFDPLDRFAQTAAAKILHDKIEAELTEGVNWARARTQALYDGEDYFLMLDSHIQFTPDWDQLARRDHEAASRRTGKAVVTAYLPPYEFADGERRVPCKGATNFRLHATYGIPGATAYYIPSGLLPEPTHFFSAHFAFTSGDFVELVPCDPELFFFGDEMSLAVRAASAGYALHVPSRYLGAHLYRNPDRPADAEGGRALVWEGQEEERRRVKWWQRDLMSKHKIRAICRGEWFGRFGIADIAEYRRFAEAVRNIHGIDLAAVTF